jgi:hypothetical protein
MCRLPPRARLARDTRLKTTRDAASLIFHRSCKSRTPEEANGEEGKALSHPPRQGVAIKQKLASTCFKNSIDDDDICLLLASSASIHALGLHMPAEKIVFDIARPLSG